jgi:hypothetical protein
MMGQNDNVDGTQVSPQARRMNKLAVQGRIIKQNQICAELRKHHGPTGKHAADLIEGQRSLLLAAVEQARQGTFNLRTSIFDLYEEVRNKNGQ